MKLKAVLFDLDGTLLPMDLGKFLEAYFALLSKRLVPHGYDPIKLIKAIWSCTGAMMTNDGSVTNEQAFWNAFSSRELNAEVNKSKKGTIPSAAV